MPLDFSPATSFFVKCEAQAEIDEFWKKLSANKDAEQWGWLQDKFGFSWQIVPSMLNEWLTGSDPAKTERVMKAVLRMRKLDLEKMKQAAG